MDRLKKSLTGVIEGHLGQAAYLQRVVDDIKPGTEWVNVQDVGLQLDALYFVQRYNPGHEPCPTIARWTKGGWKEIFGPGIVSSWSEKSELQVWV